MVDSINVKKDFKDVLESVTKKRLAEEKKERADREQRENKRNIDLRKAQNAEKARAEKSDKEIERLLKELGKYETAKGNQRRGLSEKEQKQREELRNALDPLLEIKEFNKGQIAMLSRADKKEEFKKSAAVLAIEDQKKALENMKGQIEANGGVASENKEFQREELRIAREEFKLRRQQATGKGAKEEINKEERAMMKKQGTFLQKISAGIGGMFANMKEGAKAAATGSFMKILKGTLFVGLFLALAAFFNSDMFPKVIDVITNTILPGLITVGKFFIDVGARVIDAFKNVYASLEKVFDSELTWTERFYGFAELFSADGAIALGITSLIGGFAVFKLLKVGKGALFGTIGLFTKLFGSGGDIDLATQKVVEKSGGSSKKGPKGSKGLWSNLAKGKGGIFKSLGKLTGIFMAGGLFTQFVDAVTSKATADIDKMKKDSGVDTKNKTKTNQQVEADKKKTQAELEKQKKAQVEVEKAKKSPELVEKKPKVNVAKEVASGGSQSAGKTAAKGLTKAALKKIPIAGAFFGTLFAAQRAIAGDYSGAAMEFASGLAGAIPILGTAASLGIDAALIAKDMGAFNKVTAKIQGGIEEKTARLETLQEELANTSGMGKGPKRRRKALTKEIETLNDEINALRNEQMQVNALRKGGVDANGNVITMVNDNKRISSQQQMRAENISVGYTDPIIAMSMR
tara:strand:- start:7 stop:2076 length:2070 start_codon:yes stop_codon:yes gene_type:complete